MWHPVRHDYFWGESSKCRGFIHKNMVNALKKEIRWISLHALWVVISDLPKTDIHTRNVARNMLNNLRLVNKKSMSQAKKEDPVTARAIGAWFVQVLGKPALSST